MNAMVQDMSWDLAARQEGSEITALHIREIDQISGGSPLYQHIPEFIAFAAAVAGLAKALRK